MSNLCYTMNQTNYNKIPGSPIAYWLNKNWYKDFELNKSMRSQYEMKKGTSTGDNELLGYEMKSNAVILNHGGHWSRYIVSPDKFFKDNITWSAISSKKITVRYTGIGFAFSSAAMEIFGDDLYYILTLLNSVVAEDVLKALAPTINFGVEQIGNIPVIKTNDETINDIALINIQISKTDWDSFETSWDFKKHPLI